MRTGAGLGAAVIVVLLVALPAAGQSTSQDHDRVIEEIQELARQIREQEGRRSEIQEEIASAQARMAEVQARLDEAQAVYDRVLADIAATEAKHRQLSENIDQLQRQLAETRIGLRDTRIRLRERAVEMYVSSGADMTVLVTGLEEVSNLAVGLQYAKEIATDTGNLVRALEGLQSQEERQRQLLESDQREAETTLAQLAERQLEIEAEQARIDTLKAEVRSELDRHRQLLAEVERRINEFESEHAHAEEDLARIEREIRSLDSDEGTSPSVLRWPLNSVVTSPFGYRVHPILGTRRLHTGIDLRGSNGTPIGAAGDGTVILARAWGGYGNTVVIDHGGGLTTLYAHQSRVEVSSGEKVSAGQVIGHVGSSGLSTGAHLHFEARVNGTPVDPVQYLP